MNGFVTSPYHTSSIIDAISPIGIPTKKTQYSISSSAQCNPVMIAFYNRLREKDKNGKVIVCAIMRKLVHIIFGILKSGKKFDPNHKPVFA